VDKKQHNLSQKNLFIVGMLSGGQEPRYQQRCALSGSVSA